MGLELGLTKLKQLSPFRAMLYKGICCLFFISFAQTIRAQVSVLDKAVASLASQEKRVHQYPFLKSRGRKMSLPITFYKRFISSQDIPGTCRFELSCSEFADRAIKKHGPIKGVFEGLDRLMRCNFFIGTKKYPVNPDTKKFIDLP